MPDLQVSEPRALLISLGVVGRKRLFINGLEDGSATVIDGTEHVDARSAIFGELRMTTLQEASVY